MAVRPLYRMAKKLVDHPPPFSVHPICVGPRRRGRCCCWRCAIRHPQGNEKRRARHFARVGLDPGIWMVQPRRVYIAALQSSKWLSFLYPHPNRTFGVPINDIRPAIHLLAKSSEYTLGNNVKRVPSIDNFAAEASVVLHVVSQKLVHDCVGDDGVALGRSMEGSAG